MSRALRGETVRSEKVLLSPAGLPRRWLRISASPLLADDGTPSGAVATFDDVTREHELETQLHTTMWRLQMLVEHALDATFLTRLDRQPCGLPDARHD